MDDVTALAVLPCNHKGWSLWISYWEWWCGNCGITFPEYDMINFPNAHKVGDYCA